jgi:hypothetical protein
VVDYINLYGGKFIRSSSANLETITRTTYNSSLNGLQFQVKELTTQYILDISKATLCATGPDIAENYKFILSYAEPASISGQTASINTSGLVIYDVTPAKPSIGQLCAQQRSPVKISEQYQDNMLGPFFVTDVMAQRFASIFNTAIKNLAHVRRRRYR